MGGSLKGGGLWGVLLKGGGFGGAFKRGGGVVLMGGGIFGQPIIVAFSTPRPPPRRSSYVVTTRICWGGR